MKTYWAIEDKNGKWVDNDILKTPYIYQTQKDANRDCTKKGERPVKVEVRKVEG